MASIPGARFDISGASGSQGLLAPKDGWRAFFLPRGAYTSQDSTGTLITFDSANVASRFAVNDWIQVGTNTANIRQVGAVGGNSISISGANLTVTENDRVFLIGSTEPTVSGNSATYTPNTYVRHRDDDASDLYTNSMVTTNANGLVQAYAGTSIYDVMLQDGNRTNQGYVADLAIGIPEGISVTDGAFFGSTATFYGTIVIGGSISITGLTLTTLGVTGVATFGNTVTIKNGPSQIRHADQYMSGSSTGGLQEAHDDLPSTGGWIFMGPKGRSYYKSFVVSKTDVTVIGAGDASFLQAAASTHCITVAAHRFTARSFKIDGGNTTFTAGRGVHIDNTINGTWCDNITVVRTPDAGISEWNTHDLTRVTNCRIERPGDASSTDAMGIQIGASSSNFQIRANRVIASTLADSSAIFCSAGCADGEVIGNLCSDGGNNGIRVGMIRGVIAQNSCIGFNTDAYRLDTDGTVITHNLAKGSTGQGFKTDGCTNTIISFNEADSNSNGIYINNAVGIVNGLEIIGNICKNNLGRGIGSDISGTSQKINRLNKCTISDNYVENNTFSGISIDCSTGNSGSVVDLFIINNYCKANALSGILISPGFSNANVWTNVVVRNNNLVGNTQFGLNVTAHGTTSTYCIENNFYNGNSASTVRSTLSVVGWSACATSP